jgi:opacity protein-like surface antigen
MKKSDLNKFLKSCFGLLLLTIVSFNLQAQEDLLKEIEDNEPKEKEYAFATFKGTRLVNGHSVETKKTGELEMIISHRFGKLNSGSVNFWGLDEAYIRIGLEYGITNRLTLGIGRNSYNKIYDGFFKYRLLRQSTGPGSSPLTVTVFASTGIQAYPTTAEDSTLSFFDRATYTYQLLIARKLSSKLSMQISPTLVHTNRIDQELYNNDQYALGVGGRYKLTGSLSLNAEYYYRISPKNSELYQDAFSIGFDIETGGHVFQLIFSNTQGMVERTFITNTEGKFFKGDIHFGFNITRTFQVKKNKR